MDWITVLISLIKIVGFVFLLLMPMVAYSVYAERRLSAVIQDRVGPNRTGIPFTKIRLAGLGQPIVDGLKFFLKEDFTPAHVKKFYFWLAPALTLIPALLTVAVIPFSSPLDLSFLGLREPIPMLIADLDVGPLFVFAISSLGVYGIVIAGWSSNSKYPFLGGVRSSAQMISYEIALGLSIIPVLMIFGNLNLSKIVQYQSEHGWLMLPVSFFGEGTGLEWWHQALLLIPVFIAFVIFTTSIFAETNRTPFDLPECETELVAGYHTEYSSMKFAMFFMGEYAAMIVGSGLIVTLFLGGWSLPFGLDIPMGQWLQGAPWLISLIHLGVFISKIVLFILFFIAVRWTVPRFRFDQLMSLGWIVFFELALVNVFITAGILMLTHAN